MSKHYKLEELKVGMRVTFNELCEIPSDVPILMDATSMRSDSGDSSGVIISIGITDELRPKLFSGEIFVFTNPEDDFVSLYLGNETILEVE